MDFFVLFNILCMLHRISDMQFSFREKQSTPATCMESPILSKKPTDTTKPSASQLTLKLTKTTSFDDREELHAVHETISEEYTSDMCPKELLVETIANILPKTIINKNENEKSDLNTVNIKTSDDDNTVITQKPSVPYGLSTEITMVTPTPSSYGTITPYGTTPTINVVCPIGDEESKPMDCEDTSIIQPSHSSTSLEQAPAELKSSYTEEFQPFKLDVNTYDDKLIPQEELSPTTDEYQECCPPDDYQYDISTEGDNLVPGCVAPAPTPAPSIAPLAEVEIDPPDDDLDTEDLDQSDEPIIAGPSEQHKKRKKHDSETKSQISVDCDVPVEVVVEQDIQGTTASGVVVPQIGVTQSPPVQGDDSQARNDVCPWEDE